MRTLENTKLEFVYSLLLAKTDTDVINTISVVLIVSIIFVILWNLISPFAYGKGASDGTNSSKYFWNYPISSRFCWRYAFCPTITVPFLTWMMTPSHQIWNFCNSIALLIYSIHYFNRSVIYPTKISKNAQPNPLWFFVLCFFLTIANSFYQAHHLLNVQSVGTSLWTYLGVLIWLLGMFTNSYHDRILTNLKSEKDTASSKTKSSGPTSYKIPRGGLFEYVSCANYFGEVLEWWGFALVGWGAPQVLFAVFSTTFLGLRAMFSHNFYKKSFGKSYPPNRKVIIPFIF